MKDVKPVDDRLGLKPHAKPRLLQLCAVDYTVRYLLLPLARALRQDFDVHFASSPGSYVEEIQGEGFGYHTITIKRSLDLFAHTRAVLQLRSLIKQQGFQIIHTHTPVASLIGRVAAKLAGVPIVLYTAHGFYFHEGMRAPVRHFFVMLERIAGHFTDFIFTQNREDRAAAVELGIVDEGRVMHIGNGVDLQRFDADKVVEKRESIRAQMHVGADQLVVCITGRLVREKGYLELIEAFAQVVNKVPQALLLAVGGALESDHDDVSSQVKAAVQRLGLSDRVRLLPYQSDIERVLAVTDVYVLPSHREGMPRSILEAMALGLPVVATSVRGSREAVVDGVTGTLVDVGDVDALAQALVNLLDDPARRKAYGDQAKVIARKEFDESVVIATQRKVLRRLCSEKGIEVR
ncbi:MAG: glycosyltransferase family 4 protein [Candidatus Krumholzibacteria bacterium]|nr:glycosyltransferase family 4 protein [Candidatus Krumholzibacteria bacterium]